MVAKAIWIDKAKANLNPPPLEHFKALKMEKIWEDLPKLLNDRLMFGDGPSYPMGLQNYQSKKG
jgi:hypothetical protein